METTALSASFWIISDHNQFFTNIQSAINYILT